MFWLLIMLLLFMGPLPVWSESGCLFCHDGIEPISEVPVMAELPCSFCHRGNPQATAKDEAHRGLWRNPSDLRVVDKTCGQCHMDIVSRLKKSLHATSAGVISGARYTWAAQKTRESLYGNYAVEDTDGQVPEERGGLRSLRALPSYDASRPIGPKNHPVDDYLRAECLRCHVWTRGKEQYGDYRASGCAACHMLYADDGLYQGDDRAVPKDRPPYPRLHRLTTQIPVYQCQHCHNRGGRTGVSYAGLMESDGYCSPWSDRPGQKAGRKLHGKCYNHLLPDIHYERGLACIDCHTEREIHGDGNIYGKKEQAVEIECESCHGTVKTPATLRTLWGNRLENLERQKEGVFLISKVDGKRHRVPQVVEVVKQNERAAVAMEIPAHVQRLECYACHAVWAPQCYGCHAQQDLSERAGDWLNYEATEDKSLEGAEANRRATVYRWRETRSYLRWESPALGINAEGRVAPFIPGCQAVFTQTGPQGATYVNHIFKTAHGHYGIATNPIQPHTIRPRARSCEDCHANPKALGLGDGIYLSRANGLKLPFGLDRFVDEEGRQLQATSHEGARPFNKEELDRILRVNTCAACHGYMRDRKFWKGLTKRFGQAPDDTAHKRILKKILIRGR